MLKDGDRSLVKDGGLYREPYGTCSFFGLLCCFSLLRCRIYCQDAGLGAIYPAAAFSGEDPVIICVPEWPCGHSAARRLLSVNDVLWLGEWVFHASLLVLFLGHLRYVLDPVPAIIAAMEIPARVAAWLLPASLFYIGVMKIIVERNRMFRATILCFSER